jgi:hypothetical protein
MGFHLLTHSNPLKTKSTVGLGITYPVLATYTKYPSASYDTTQKRVTYHGKNQDYSVLIGIHIQKLRMNYTSLNSPPQTVGYDIHSLFLLRQQMIFAIR